MGKTSGSERREKSESVRVRVSPAEKERIAAKAEAAGLSISDFMRRAALGRDVRALVDIRAIADLGRLGGLFKWWLTDGVGHDGERHRRGPAPADRRPEIEAILAGIREAIGRLGGRRRKR